MNRRKIVAYLLMFPLGYAVISMVGKYPPQLIIAVTIFGFGCLIALLFKPNQKKGINLKYGKSEETDKLYNEIKKEYDKNLSYYQKEERIDVVAIYILAILLMVAPLIMFFLASSVEIIVISIFLTILGVCAGLSLIIMANKKPVEYVDEFKGRVMTKIVKEVDNNLSYVYSNGDMPTRYGQSGFDKSYTSGARVTDLIYGKLEDGTEVRISDIIVLRQLRANSTYYENEEFEGIFVDVTTTKNIDTLLKLYPAKDYSAYDPDNPDCARIKTDLEKFDKIFSVYSDNNVTALQILTAEVMGILIDFYNETKISYDIIIKNNHIYIRLNTGAMFEPKIMRSSINEEDMNLYHTVLKFIINLTKSLNEVIKNTDV